MAVMTLRATCMEKTSDLLISGVWDRCQENPFHSMPASIVQELLSRMKPEGSERNIAHFRLLLTSGRLEHVALPPGGDEAEFAPLLQMLSRGCLSLQTLSVKCEKTRRRSVGEERALREVLCRSTKLEDLHSGIPFVPADLRNCRNLKTLRLHFGAEAVARFLDGIHSELWEEPSESQPLRSLGVLSLCHWDVWICLGSYSYILSKIAMLLHGCPQLTNLGFCDSLMALEQLRVRDLRTHATPRQFQLRRCYWGFEAHYDLPEFSEMIRVAVQSCPLIEVLAMLDCRAGLEHLKTLRNLTSLIIFVSIGDKPGEFSSLLCHIGPQLQHLCLYAKGSPLCLKAMGRHCPNLRTLQVYNNSVTAEEGLSLPSLERLSADGCKVGGLFPLLSGCPRLKVLCLEEGDCLNDEPLQPITRKNPFAKLEVVLIRRCRLRESRWRRFIQSATGLRSCCLNSTLILGDGMAQCVRDLNPSVVCHRSRDFAKLCEEHFPMRLASSCWL